MTEGPLSVSAPQRIWGYAGLIPPAACLIMPLVAGPGFYWTALAALYVYTAMIFSFLGGIWWGLASSSHLPRGRALAVSVLPPLLAWASFVPWLLGWPWPKPSLALLSLLTIVSPLFDRAIVGERTGAAEWLEMRVHLSLGLGLSGLAFALI